MRWEPFPVGSEGRAGGVRWGRYSPRGRGYHVPLHKVTCGEANVTRSATTAQFHKRKAIAVPNPTRPGANVTHLRTSLQRQQEKHHKRAARFVRRPLRDACFFLLPLQ